MKLPVDTSSMSFICAPSPSPVVDFESRRPKTDENGQPLYVVQLVVLSEGTTRDHRGQGAQQTLVHHPPGPSGPRRGPHGPAMDIG
jgi:hypothetical protein